MLFWIIFFIVVLFLLAFFGLPNKEYAEFKKKQEDLFKSYREGREKKMDNYDASIDSEKLTPEENQLLNELIELDKSVPYDWEFEGDPPYNLQVENIIATVEPNSLYPDGKVHGHPNVLMKTVRGWEPHDNVAKMITKSRNSLPILIDIIRRLSK